MGVLIDTNVISELRKGSRCNPKVAAWQRTVTDTESFVSAITMMELRHGILIAKRKDPDFAGLLEEWYERQVKAAFINRVIPIDLLVSEECSSVMSRRTRSLADALIAATARVHGLILATRNVDDFADCGLSIVNPWN